MHARGRGLWEWEAVLKPRRNGPVPTAAHVWLVGWTVGLGFQLLPRLKAGIAWGHMDHFSSIVFF